MDRRRVKRRTAGSDRAGITGDRPAPSGHRSCWSCWSCWSDRSAGGAVITLALVFAGCLLGAGTVPQAHAADRVPLPVLVKAHKGEACVEPLPVIRRDHMKFLMHQRDDTVHEGIRGARHSLVGCIDCHAARNDSGQWVRIDAPGQFCASCHEYASVKIDCFGCHAALPAAAFTEAAE